jgi:hypothetical protein
MLTKHNKKIPFLEKKGVVQNYLKIILQKANIVKIKKIKKKYLKAKNWLFFPVSMSH